MSKAHQNGFLSTVEDAMDGAKWATKEPWIARFATRLETLVTRWRGDAEEERDAGVSGLKPRLARITRIGGSGQALPSPIRAIRVIRGSFSELLVAPISGPHRDGFPPTAEDATDGAVSC